MAFIYFDNAATTEPFPLHVVPMYNPSSPHGLGIHAERMLHDARKKIGTVMGISKPAKEIIFTSGATEANNLAIFGSANVHRRKDFSVCITGFEHPSILEPIMHMKTLGLAAVHVGEQQWHLASGTVLYCLSHINHETGDILDIQSAAQHIKSHNPNAIILIDGAQAFCKMPMDLAGIDFYSFTGHKIHAIPGVGGLYVRESMRIEPLVFGGGQEFGLRSGTENLLGITHMADCAEKLYTHQEAHHARVYAVKTILSSLAAELPNVTINTQTENVSPYILNMSFNAVRGETLVHALSEKGIYISMGAACRSRKKSASLLEVMGFDHDTSMSAVRFSFSHLNTEDQAYEAKEMIKSTVTMLRRVMGFS